MRIITAFVAVAAAFSATLSTVFAAEPALEVAAPVPGSKAAAAFRCKEGFSMTLLAQEPLVTDPVAMCYDADGQAYVAEMNDYPYTDKAKHQPMQENPTDASIGKIRLLTDDDGDGIFDRSTVFADDLSWPTGVVPWKGGVFVTAVPDLWYLKDSTGDGVADIKTKVASGFRKYNVQASANTPVWGPDNRIYIATGRNKGTLTNTKNADFEIAAGRDVRIDPRQPDLLELVSGGIQFGNAIDDWGNRFLCSAGGSVHHIVLPAAALDRNRWLPGRATVRGCLDSDDPVQLFPITAIESWRLQRYKDRQFVPQPGFTESRGEKPGDPARPTSSCGHAVYRGDAYPEAFRGSFFVAESCYNLIYRLDAAPQGPTFSLTKPPADRKDDFIASEDVWFRPMAMINAPDGCLHLLDMYRESIEHPWSLPEAFHERMDLLLGRDRGRLYRIEPPNYQHRSTEKLSDKSSADLVTLLEHPNAWHRETAQRLLFERQDISVVPALEKLATDSAQSLARLHALWTLHGLDALRHDILRQLATHAEPGLRKNVARVAARIDRDPSLRFQLLIAMANDPEPDVRFEVALALGTVPVSADNDRIANKLAVPLLTILKQDGSDPWSRMAALSSALPCSDELLTNLLDDESFQDLVTIGTLAKMTGAENRGSDSTTLWKKLADNGAAPDAKTFSVAIGLADGLRIAKTSLQKIATEVKGGPAYLTSLIDTARALAANPDSAASSRTDAIRFLRNAHFADVSSDLSQLLASGHSYQIQSTAASILSIVGAKKTETGSLLLAGWKGYNGELRNEILQLLLSREERLDALLQAISEGKIQPYQLGANRRDALLHHVNPGIATRAKDLLSSAASRSKILEDYQPALTLKGDASKGEIVYQSLCMACHKFREQGLIDLAPNLAAVSTWEAGRILTNILDPNRDVAPEYMEYLVETKDGNTLAGRLVSESPTGITLKLADNTTRDISRADISLLNNSGRSLMPDGLEAALTPQSMADLIAFLQTRQ